MKNYFNIFRTSVFAGILIAVAGYGFLAGKAVGMFLFILGLAAVVSYKLKLYTGTVGFVTMKELPSLLVVLLGNILGCFLVGLIAKVDTAIGVQEAAQGVLQSRMQLGWWACGVKAIGCGLLMSTAVHFARKGKEFGYWVPLLFAVPLFIHCGFPHCVADAFYFLASPGSVLAESGWELLGVYVSIVIGNSVGCNLYRWILPSENYEV
jgi:formate/nitrite transporter FocA (FNT family)